MYVPQLQFLDNGRLFFVSTKTRQNFSLTLSNEIIKELVITLETDVLTVPPRINQTLLITCSQEETDDRMFLHAINAAQRGNDMILI